MLIYEFIFRDNELARIVFQYNKYSQQITYTLINVVIFSKGLNNKTDSLEAITI